MSKPIPVKLDELLLARIESLSERLGEPKSTLMRMAMRVGLEQLEKALDASGQSGPDLIESLADQIQREETEKILSSRGSTGPSPSTLNEAAAPAAPAPGPKPGTAAASTAAKVSYRKPPRSRK